MDKNGMIDGNEPLRDLIKTWIVPNKLFLFKSIDFICYEQSTHNNLFTHFKAQSQDFYNLPHN